MRCPFLVKRKDIYDDGGRKIGEEVELLDCVKNECMVYDSATKLCSLLSSNMKTGVLIDDHKKGVKEIREEVSHSFEAWSKVYAAAVETMREGMFGRLDVQKKQMEVMILGFGKLHEDLGGKFDALNAAVQRSADAVEGRLTAMVEAADKQAGGLQSALQSLQAMLSEAGAAYVRLIGDLLTGLNGLGGRVDEAMASMKDQSAGAVSSIAAKLDALGSAITELSKTAGGRGQEVVERMASFDEGMKRVMSELRFEISSTSDRFRDEISGHIDALKTEVVNMKTGQAASLNSVNGGLSEVRDLFARSTSNLESMSGMIDKLNKNYLESLAKIAGLAEGMKKGVADIGASMDKSLREMVGETSGQIGAAAKQYEKTLTAVGAFTGIFDGLNKRLGEMATSMESNFKESLDRQTKLSSDTKGILESMKTFLQRQSERFDKEQESNRKKSALDHFDRATLYYYRGNYELAQNEIDRALEIDKTAEYTNLKGLILSELGKYEDSKEAFLAAIKLEPEFSELYNNLGLLHLKMKKIDDAVVSFQESVKKNVNNAVAYVNLGKALIEAERFDEGLAAYNRALQIDPSNREAGEAVRLYQEGKIETR